MLLQRTVPHIAIFLSTILILCQLSPRAVGQTIVAAATNRVTISVGRKVVRSHRTNPLELGFNISADGIIDSTPGGSNTLWDSARHEITPALIGFMKSGFEGAVFRFPGGTVSNILDWYGACGDMKNREAHQEHSVWGGGQRYVAQFGIPEFMTFVERAKGGAPVFVLNLLTKDGTPVSDAQWPAALQSQVSYLEYLNAPVNQDWSGDGIKQGIQRAKDGHPAPYNVYRFELGNELDMKGGLTKEAYVARCKSIIDAFNKHTMPGRPYAFMALGSTIIMGNSSWEDWDKYVVANLGGQISSMVAHTYYDGYSIPWNMANTQTLVNDEHTWAATAKSHHIPNVSVTEHGRWPSNLGDNKTWAEDVRTSAAVSTVDMIISLEQQPAIGLSLNHGIENWSPWGLFLPSNAKGYIDPGPFSPEPSANAQKLAALVLHGSDILETTILSPHNAGYGDITHPPFCLYDVRATGYVNGQGQYGVLAVNRWSGIYPLDIDLVGLDQFTGPLVLRMDQVNSGSAGIATKYISAQVMNGKMTVSIPPLGVYNYTVVTPLKVRPFRSTRPK